MLSSSTEIWSFEGKFWGIFKKKRVIYLNMTALTNKSPTDIISPDSVDSFIHQSLGKLFPMFVHELCAFPASSQKLKETVLLSHSELCPIFHDSLFE